MRRDTNFRSIVAILATSVLFACTQEAMDSLPQTESKTDDIKELPRHRTYEEALAIAQDAIGLLGESSTTRSGKPRTVNTSEVQYILNTSATRSDEEPDTLMYVFNYEDNAGFAVVSVNRATEELIAVTEQGHYIAGEETENEGFDFYMDMAKIYTRINNYPLDTIGNKPAQLIYETVRDTVVHGPFLSVQWGQNEPYNNHCFDEDGNRAAAGCVAIALAQIMSHYKHPSSITVNYESPSYVLYLNWDNILKHKRTSTDCSCVESEATHDMIGKLIRQIGKTVKMQYGPQSGAYDADVPSSLSAFGYTHDPYTTYTSEKLISSLANGRLVYMSGSRINATSGHAWVVDGYKKITVTETEYSQTYGLPLIVLNQTTWKTIYHHINWGWNGTSNGYFIADVFDAASPYELDPNVHSIAYNYYNTNLNIYPNIRIK